MKLLILLQAHKNLVADREHAKGFREHSLHPIDITHARNDGFVEGLIKSLGLGWCYSPCIAKVLPLFLRGVSASGLRVLVAHTNASH